MRPHRCTDRVRPPGKDVQYIAHLGFGAAEERASTLRNAYGSVSDHVRMVLPL